MSITKTNGTIGVQEKKELTKIVSGEYDRIIATMKTEIEFTQGEILEDAKAKFGIKLVNQEIKNLEEKIKMLKQKKIELGFDYRDEFSTKMTDYDRQVDPKSKAGQFFYLKVSRCADIKGLEIARDSRIKNIWLNNDREVIKTLVNEAVNVPMIEHKRKK